MGIVVCVNPRRQIWPVVAAGVWAELGLRTALVRSAASGLPVTLPRVLSVLEWDSSFSARHVCELGGCFDRTVVDLSPELPEELLQIADLVLLSSIALDVQRAGRHRPVRVLAPADEWLREKARGRGFTLLESPLTDIDLETSMRAVVAEVDQVMLARFDPVAAAPDTSGHAPMMLSQPESTALLEEVRSRIAEVERSLVELAELEITRLVPLQSGRTRVRHALRQLLQLANLAPDETADGDGDGTFYVDDTRRFLNAAEAAQRVAAQVEALLVEMEEREQNTTQTPSLPGLRERIDELVAELIEVRNL